MDLTTAQSISHEDVTPEQLEAAFSDDSGRGEFIILDNNADGCIRFIQAGGEDDGPYVLEYRDESTGAHRQAVGQLNKQEVKAAFLDYLSGSNTWCDRFAWTDVKRAGCLPMILLLSAAVWLPTALIRGLV